MDKWKVPSHPQPRKGNDLPIVVYAIIMCERTGSGQQSTGKTEQPLDYVYLMSLRSLLDDTNPGCYGFPGGSVKKKMNGVADELKSEVEEEVGFRAKLLLDAIVTVLWGPSNKVLEGLYLPSPLSFRQSNVQIPLAPWPVAKQVAAGYVGPYRYWQGHIQSLDFQIDDWEMSDSEKCYIFIPCEVDGFRCKANIPNGDSREVFGLHWADQEQWRRLSSGHLVRLQPVVATFVYAFDPWF